MQQQALSWFAIFEREREKVFFLFLLYFCKNAHTSSSSTLSSSAMAGTIPARYDLYTKPCKEGYKRDMGKTAPVA